MKNDTELSLEEKLDLLLDYCKSLDIDSVEDKNNRIKNAKWNELAKKVSGDNNKDFLLKIQHLEKEGLIERVQEGYVATPKGKLFEGYSNKKQNETEIKELTKENMQLDIAHLKMTLQDFPETIQRSKDAIKISKRAVWVAIIVPILLFLLQWKCNK